MVSRQNAAKPRELGGKWKAECLNTMLPLPELPHAGYSVKLKKNIIAILIWPINT